MASPAELARRLWVLTETPVDYAMLLLARARRDGVTPRVVITRDGVWRLEPHPAPLHKAAHALGLAVERTLLVGDMPVDMCSARRGGALAVGVASGFCTEPELRRAGADWGLGSVGELPDLLARSDSTRGGKGLVSASPDVVARFLSCGREHVV